MHRLHSQLVARPQRFFEESGSVWMWLTTFAATRVCQLALSEGYAVLRVEGGIQTDAGYEMALDCIWDAKDGISVAENNRLAAEDIATEAPVHDVWLVTVRRIDGVR